jgi:hypothetical protein
MDVNGEDEVEGGFVGQRLFGREICFDTENERPKNGLCCWKRMTNGVCIVNVSNEKKEEARKGTWKKGGQRNDFRKQKLKGFSFVRISKEKLFSSKAFSDDV